MSNHNVELHLVDICLTSDEVILVSGVWYNKENLRVNLVIYKIIYNNKEDNLELFMSLSEDLDGHILNNKCSLKLNDEHRISRILLSEKGYIICIFEVEDNLKGVPAVISVWKLNQHSQPRLIYINSCSLDFSNIDHVEKFLRDDIFDAFTQSAQSGAAEFSVIISGKYMEELVIVSIPQLDCTTKSCSNSEDEDGEFTSCLEKMCIPADLCSKLENISKEGKPFSSPTLLEYRSLVISPNGIYAKKFGVFDKHTNIKSLSTEKPQMLVMIIPLLSDSKINAANVENLINYIFNILLLALTNNRDYQDVVNLIYEYEFKYPSNRILDRLIERISSIASEDFPSYSSSLSMDGKIFFLLISLCRYKYIRSCVNFDIIVQTQYLIEGCLSSFKVKNQVLNLAEKIINSNSINVEASVSGFSKFVDLKYENFPKVMLFGSWFLELCATISRSLHVLSKTVFEKKNTDSEESQHSEVETDAFPDSKKYNNMGIVAVMLSVQYLKAMILLSLIFFIARDKLDYLLSLKDINHSQNSAILNELLNSRNTFDSNKLRISKFTIFLLKVLNLINHQEITPSESLKYLHKDSPKNHPTLIPQMIKLFHEHVVEFYPSLSSPKNSFNKTESKGDGVAVTPMRVLALERQVENIFAYINANFLNLWTFYSSYPYTEIVYAKMPSLFENMLQRKEIRRGAFFDILTKRRIGSNKNILICNRCNHHSADTIKMPETNNRNLNSSKSTCICGGTWRRISLGAI